MNKKENAKQMVYPTDMTGSAVVDEYLTTPGVPVSGSSGGSKNQNADYSGSYTKNKQSK